ncbi:hypothetical protein E2C01_049848 [Portunus trituberculatus]|uniref:Uncharacterized protein n=1 Tax=Portunus trituberculatus TaxID=210409 RepID=A0A5B7GAJ8_PORTR|nr:hypothetical protein [Portunus trituberculatus]
MHSSFALPSPIRGQSFRELSSIPSYEHWRLREYPVQQRLHCHFVISLSSSIGGCGAWRRHTTPMTTAVVILEVVVVVDTENRR